MRTIVYVFGLLLLVRGLLISVNPQLWRSLAQRYARAYLPQSVNQMVAEYARLSDRSLSILGMWTALMGVLMVALAARTRD